MSFRIQHFPAAINWDGGLQCSCGVVFHDRIEDGDWLDREMQLEEHVKTEQFRQFLEETFRVAEPLDYD